VKKTILSVGSCLFVGLFVGLLTGPQASAAQLCSSGFCNGASNGAQCTLNGVTHTCGKCTSHSGADANSLYIGALSAAEAKEKCETQYGQAPPPPPPKTAPLEKQPVAPKAE
jgi:hypothetical protein